MKLLNFLTSRKTNLFLLAVTVALFFAGEWGNRLQPGFVLYRTWWFSGLIILIALNSAACSVKRLFRVEEGPGPYNRIRFVVAGGGDMEKTSKKLQKLFTKAGYRITGDAPFRWVASKGKTAIWGSVLFHVSFSIAGLGIILNNLFGMSGAMAIPVGHTVVEEHDAYVGKVWEGAFFGESHAGFSIYVDDLRPEFRYGNKTFSALEGHVLLKNKEGGSLSQPIRPNKGITFGGRKIMLGNFGAAPVISVHFNGTERWRSIITLAAGGKTGPPLTFYDTVELPQTPVLAKIRIYPEAESKSGQWLSRSLLLKNPVMELELWEGSNLLKKGFLKPGEALALPSGLVVKFEAVRYYGFFNVSFLPGLWVMYAGLFLGAGGLIVTLLSDYRVITVEKGSQNGQQVLVVSGWAYHYKNSLAGLIRNILHAFEYKEDNLAKG